MLRKTPLLLIALSVVLLCAWGEIASGGENVLRPASTKVTPLELRPAVSRHSPRPAQYLQEEPLVAPEPVPAEEESTTAGEDPTCGTENFPVPGRMHRYRASCPPTPLEMQWAQRLSRALEGHRDPNDPDRHFGVGDPLMGTSWRNRPWYVSGFVGGLIGDDLQTGLVSQGGGFFAGGRFGGDFDHFWGSEVRFAFSDLNVNYPNLVGSGQSKDTFFDANLLYYPLGDTRWRPFLSLGFGIASFKYDDPLARQIHAASICFPFGGGLKYYLGRQWAMRFDITDNFTWDAGSRADSMHNVSFTGGVEYHFGGHTTSYDPW